MRIDTEAPRFALADSMLVPIAARDQAAIELFVGEVLEVTRGRDRGLRALSVVPHPREEPAQGSALLWSHPRRGEFEARLFPARQIWVHVDYRNYRKAFLRLGGGEIPPGYVLDHIQNRVAMRLRGNSHPWLRLCPVASRVNTSGGHSTGAEGLEKDYLRGRGEDQDFQRALSSHRLIYADPSDLTKMLDRPPGTLILDGVRVTQELFYPPRGK